MDDLFTNKPRTTPGYQDSRKFYPDEFVDSLANEYGFNSKDIDLLTYLYEIPYRYELANSIAEGDREYQPRHRKELLELQTKFLAFKEELFRQGGDYFNLEVSGGARACGDLDPELDPEDYPGKQFSKNYCYWFEFERYLKFFETGLAQTLESHKPRGGRPKNEGLHLAVHYIAEFWEFKLKRRYTLDHHSGRGLTEAYDFTEKLLRPLAKISQKQIITAMRAEIKSRREMLGDYPFHKNPSPNSA